MYMHALSSNCRIFRYCLFIACYCFSLQTEAQKDSLVLKNGDIIVGELKSLDKGVVTVETDYSKSDFTIEWSGIREIYLKSRFLITMKDGRRINGTFQSVKGTNEVHITNGDSTGFNTAMDDIVFLKGLKSDFWSRAHASIDFGLSIAKANNLKQYSMRSAAGYVADLWLAEFYYNDNRSSQDSLADIKRTESGGSYTWFLPNDWYLVGAVTTLSNTEQALKMRFSAKTGAGKYLLHTNKAYMGLGAGLSLNHESFTNDTPERTSLEGYFGASVNLFDIGDLSLLSNLYVYPGLTESGRWRSDFKFDIKYDLPMDFYLKFGITLNYDNRPAVAGKETDYVYVFSVGWEL